MVSKAVTIISIFLNPTGNTANTYWADTQMNTGSSSRYNEHLPTHCVCMQQLRPFIYRIECAMICAVLSSKMHVHFSIWFKYYLQRRTRFSVTKWHWLGNCSSSSIVMDAKLFVYSLCCQLVLKRKLEKLPSRRGEKVIKLLMIL